MNHKNHRSDIWLRFLAWFCPPSLYEGIEGDLLEQFETDVKEVGEKKARRRFVWNVIRFFRPGILFRNSFILINKNLMLRNYTKIAWRYTLKNKTFSFINTVGLTIGITVCLLVLQYVSFEMSFDNFHVNADRLCRVNLYNTKNGVFDKIDSQTVPALGYNIKESVSGVAEVARITNGFGKAVVSYELDNGQKEYVESRIVHADPSLFTMFSFPFVSGDPSTALDDKNTVVISQAVATRYFGNDNPLNKILKISNVPYVISGVFKDIPTNSHFNFEMVLPPKNVEAWNEDWAWSEVYTYVLLDDETTPSVLEPSLRKIVKQFHSDDKGDKYLLEPLCDIRLSAMDGSGRATYIYFFSALGFIILFLAWFNYINLSTAKSFERIKEVGVRKVIGARRKQLIAQFLFESLLLNMLSVFFALLLFYFAWPLMFSFLDRPFEITLWKDLWFWISVGGFLFVSALVSGFYPAFFLSAFKPSHTFREIPGNWSRATLRKSLVVVQFSISIILITGVLAIHRQIGFMRQQDLGITLDQTLIIEEPLLTDNESAQKFKPFVNEILQQSSVHAVTHATSFPGAEIDWHRTDIKLQSEDSDFRFDSRIIAVGYDFLETFNLSLVAGRNFIAALESDQRAMLLNEEASKMFGFTHHEDALGKFVFIGSRKFEVIGVIKNYHYISLQSGLQPILYFPGSTRGPKYAVKVSSEDLPKTIALIEKKWREAYSGNVFHYYFLDDFFDHQYTTDRKLGVLVGSVTSIAIIISCLGLFGLSLYAALRRTKEIGIRKVLGATISDVVFMLSNDFGKLIIAGGVVSIPLAYYVVQLWLQRYTYKMPVDGWLFIFPLLSTIILAFITISYQTVRAAKRNPVDSLRYE